MHNTYLDLPVKGHVRTKDNGEIFWNCCVWKFRNRQRHRDYMLCFLNGQYIVTSQPIKCRCQLSPPPPTSYCQCQYTHCSKKTMGFLTRREASRCSLFYSVLNVKEKLSKNFFKRFLTCRKEHKIPMNFTSIFYQAQLSDKVLDSWKKIGFSCRSQNVTK